jgi:hypothetical protein
MNDIYKPKPANDGTHKYYVILPSGKKLKFGNKNYEDYTIHRDDERKARYLARHQKRENWNDINTAGAWSRWLLWNKPTIKASYEDIKRRFKL